MAPRLTLGYWDIRGFAQPIRLLLAHAGADFAEEFHSMSGPPDFSKEAWFAVKPTLPLDFPNLPYLYDAETGVKISQSVTILRYLGRKFNLIGGSEGERVRIDLVEQQLVDWRNQGLIFYDPEYVEKHADAYKAGIKEKLAQLSAFLGDRQFLSGGSVSYVDFLAYEYLDVHARLLIPGLLSQFPNLEALVKRIEELPGVKAFMASERFIKYPVNNHQAKWGSKYVPL